MPSRRHFLARLAVAGASLPALPAFRPDAFARLLRAEPATAGRTPSDLADDESYWTEIQRAFDADRTIVNLNNGGVSPTPSHVLER